VSETCRVIINQVKQKCISLVIYLYNIIRMHGTMDIKFLITLVVNLV